MNQLIVVSVLLGLTVIGLFSIMSTAAVPTGEVTGVNNPGNTVKLPPIVDGKQDIFLNATRHGTYSPNYLVVKKGVPVRLHYSADEDVGCGREVIFPEFHVRKLAPSGGEAIIEFTPARVGKFPFHCPMNMFQGTIEVVA